MHPLDLSPHTSSLPGKCVDVEPSIRIRKFSENLNNKIPNINRRDRDQGKRGRPRAELLTALMVEGSSSRSRIRCNKCGRVFPREKSLQAHLRTHTGERPYTCDYPGCTKAFCQSGQLKTHQRLHTGERPFICIIDGCTSRFAHANRHCSQHPHASLKRLEMNLEDVTKLCEDEGNPEVIKWITKYATQCREKVNPKSPIKKTSSTESMDFKFVKTPTTNEASKSPLKKTNTESIDYKFVKAPILNEVVSRSWSLPRIPSSLTSLNAKCHSPPLLVTSELIPYSSTLSSAPFVMSPIVPRQMSASSTASSSSGVSSMSTFSSSSTSLQPLHQDLSIPEPQNDAQEYIYSSHLILQGQYSDETTPLCTTPWSNRITSPSVHDSSVTDYRASPPNSPVLIQHLRSRLLTPLTENFIPTLSSKLPDPSQLNCPLAPTLFISQTSPTLPIKSITPTLPSKQPTAALPSMSQTTLLSSKLIIPNKPPSPVMALKLEAPDMSKPTSPIPVNQKSEPNLNETTSSISYRTTPKNREKDRYISALALIELSKS